MPNNDSQTTRFTGEIRVASRIIDYLSSGLYPSPAACLKELINNSYDADALRVNVFVKPDADRIIIEDDGVGMNKFEFTTHFDRISESHKREGGDYTKLGRPKIGKIGIGFIAANELCEEMEIFSTKSGSSELLHVIIDFKEMRKPIKERRREKVDIVKADYSGEVLETKKNEHYTHIFLKQVRGEAKDILAGATAQARRGPSRSLYGLSSKSIHRELTRPDIRTWKNFDTYSETLLKVALNIPVPYFENWLPPRLAKKVEDFEDIVKSLRFSVSYDGSDLTKPIVFSHKGRSFIHKFEYSGKNVSAQGYFYAQHGSIKPIELHGLLIRIRNAAVGEYDPSFWDFSQSEFPLIQRWISGEVWADDRLEEAMNIDRSTLREAHPAYAELRDIIHSELRIVFRQARDVIYGRGSRDRKRQKADEESQEIVQFARKDIKQFSTKLARSLVKQWQYKGDDAELEKALLKTYSVYELYAIVVEVAKETLPKSHLELFLTRLSDRLKQ